MRAHRSIPTYLCAAIGLLGACSSSPTEPSETKRSPLPPGGTLVLLVAPSKTTIKGGQTFQLTASRESPRGQSIAPTEIVWASSNLKVARIDLDGTVLSAGRGTVQITAQWHGMKGAATVGAMPKSGSRCSGDKRSAAVEVRSSMRIAGRALVAAARWNAVAPGLTLEQQRRTAAYRRRAPRSAASEPSQARSAPARRCLRVTAFSVELSDHRRALTLSQLSPASPAAGEPALLQRRRCEGGR
jgi:hypothetical protein